MNFCMARKLAEIMVFFKKSAPNLCKILRVFFHRRISCNFVLSTLLQVVWHSLPGLPPEGSLPSLPFCYAFGVVLRERGGRGRPIPTMMPASVCAREREDKDEGAECIQKLPPLFKGPVALNSPGNTENVRNSFNGANSTLSAPKSPKTFPPPL